MRPKTIYEITGYWITPDGGRWFTSHIPSRLERFALWWQGWSWVSEQPAKAKFGDYPGPN